MSNFIPSNDDQFNHFAITLNSQVTASANPLKLPANVLAQWNAAFPA